MPAFAGHDIMHSFLTPPETADSMPSGNKGMGVFMRRFLIFGLAGFLLSRLGAGAGQDDAGLTTKFDAAINPHELDGWLKLLAPSPIRSARPTTRSTPTGSWPKFKSFGWDAHIEQSDVLYPTPISEAVEMPSYQGKKWSATLQERRIPGDTSATAKDYALPAYLAFRATAMSPRRWSM